MECALTVAKQHAEFGLTDPRSVFQHGLKNRLQIAGRTGDDLEHLRGRGLLVASLSQFVGERPNLVLEIGD